MSATYEKFLATIFKNLETAELAIITPFLIAKKFKPKDLILKQGENGGSLYCLVQGNIEAKVVLPGDHAKTAMYFEPGEFFGEIAFLSHYKIAASSIALSNVLCLIFKPSLLTMLRIAYPEIAYKFEKTIAEQVNKKATFHFYRIQKLLQTLANKPEPPVSHSQLLPKSQAKKELINHSLDAALLIKIPFFSAFETDKLVNLLQFMRAYRFDKGYRFKMEKNAQYTINIICSGAVMFFIKNKNCLLRSLAVYGVGKLFINNSAEFDELAEYITCERTVVLQLTNKNYQKLQKEAPEIFYLVSQFIHQNSVESLYLLNREFVRLNSEYSDLLS